MHLFVREGTTTELIEGMEHGEFDLAITLPPIDRRLFSYERVMGEELILAVSSSYSPFTTVEVPGRKHPTVEASVLNGKSMVMLTETQFMQRQL